MNTLNQITTQNTINNDIFKNNIIKCNNLPQGEINLQSQDKVDIKFDYCTSTFTPYDWKWKSLKMIPHSKLTIKGDDLKSTDKVTAVIINKSDKPENPPYSKDKVIFAHPQWNEKEKAFIAENNTTLGCNDAIFISTRGFSGDVNYDQEIAIQVNDKWLEDPVNKSHNFKFDIN